MSVIDKYIRFRKSTAIPFFFGFVGLVLLALSVFLFVTGSNSTEYSKTTAVISDIDSYLDDEGETVYTAMATYTVGDTVYMADVGWQTGWTVGTEISVRYDPEDPSRVQTVSPVLIAFLVLALAVIFLAVFAVTTVRNIRRSRKIAAQDRAFEKANSADPAFATGISYEPDLAEGKKLYYSLDKRFLQGGYMEDENRVKICEAIIENFTLFRAQRVRFINHQTAHEETHLVGHTVSTGDGVEVNSGFSYDGKPIWDYLHDQGIRIKTDAHLDTMGATYTVSRCGKLYATVTTCGVKVHEEEASGVFSHISTRGFYRIVSYSSDMDLLFLTVFAFSRSNQLYFS